jgi:uncharacterized membrane protein
MLLLVLGLAVFLGMHVFTMLRGPRAALVGRLGEGGYKGLYSLVSLAGFLMIIWGFGAYRASGYIPLWNPPTWFGHIALLLNLPIFILLAAAYLPGKIKAATKHPMLLAVKIWATAHLLSNGDFGSILLFGGFLAWAVAARISLKRRDAPTMPVQAAAFGTNDWIAIGAGVGLYVAMVLWLHPLLIGVPVLPGR